MFVEKTVVIWVVDYVIIVLLANTGCTALLPTWIKGGLNISDSECVNRSKDNTLVEGNYLITSLRWCLMPLLTLLNTPTTLSFTLHWGCRREKKQFRGNNDGVMAPVCIQTGAIKVGGACTVVASTCWENQRGAPVPNLQCSALIIQEERKEQSTG